jgi:hypothetical protein
MAIFRSKPSRFWFFVLVTYPYRFDLRKKPGAEYLMLGPLSVFQILRGGRGLREKYFFLVRADLIFATLAQGEPGEQLCLPAQLRRHHPADQCLRSGKVNVVFYRCCYITVDSENTCARKWNLILTQESYE